MDTGALDVLHDAGDQDVLAVGNDIHFQFLAHEVLVHQHRVFDLAGENDLHIGPHVLVIVSDDHVLAADDVGGAQQHGIAQLMSGVQRLLHTGDGPALRPLDREPLQQGIEPLPVLCHVDGLSAGTQNGDTVAVQELGELDGRLAAESYHHAHGLLHLDDVHDILGEQRFKVKAIGGIIVRGDGLGVVVDDDYLVAQLLQRPDAVDGGVVKLNALADADGAGAKHHNDRLAAAGEGPGFAELIKRGIEIGSLGIELRAAGVHHLVDGVFLFTGQRGSAGESLEGIVGIAHLLTGLIMLNSEAVLFQSLFKFRHFLQLCKEPAVDPGDAEDLVDGRTALQGLKDGEQPMVIHPAEPLPDGGAILGIVFTIQAVQTHFRAADGLHQRHLKAGSDGHDLTGSLHLGAQLAAGVGKLVEGPLGHLHHDVVDGRLKAGAGLAGDVIFDLVQGVAQGDLGGDLGNGIAGGLGGQGGGTGHTGVHLNDRIFKAVRVQRQLHIAAAHDTKMGDDVQRCLAEHLEFLVRQGLGGGHHDGIAGVDANGVKVLHGADGDHVAHAVPHGLKLDLLPAEDGPLHQNLGNRRGIQTGLGDDPQLRFVGSGAAAGTAQSKGGTDDDGITDPLGHL